MKIRRLLTTRVLPLIAVAFALIHIVDSFLPTLQARGRVISRDRFTDPTKCYPAFKVCDEVSNTTYRLKKQYRYKIPNYEPIESCGDTGGTYIDYELVSHFIIWKRAIKPSLPTEHCE